MRACSRPGSASRSACAASGSTRPGTRRASATARRCASACARCATWPSSSRCSRASTATSPSRPRPCAPRGARAGARSASPCPTATSTTSTTTRRRARRRRTLSPGASCTRAAPALHVLRRMRELESRSRCRTPEALAMQAPLGLPSGSLVADRYELTGELGRGERSVVYLARDRQTGTDVALKLLALSPATAHFSRQRLRRESEIVRALAHPGIVRPLDLVDHGSWSLIAMELITGRSLAAAVAADGPLHPDAVARLGIEISEALSAAHRCGVVHHDVKPENILLDAGGRARLADFGCARLEGQSLLTLPEDPVTHAAYLPPEVIEGQIADSRSDVYALGLALYFALVGSVPKGQRANLPPAPLAGGYHPREKRSEVPEWLDEIVARATRAQPGHRLETAQRLGGALSPRPLDRPGGQGCDGRRPGVRGA